MKTCLCVVSVASNGDVCMTAQNARLTALRNATPDRWVALSADETRIVAEGETFAEASVAAQQAGENDPLLVRVPPDWTPRIL